MLHIVVVLNDVALRSFLTMPGLFGSYVVLYHKTRCSPALLKVVTGPRVALNVFSSIAAWAVIRAVRIRFNYVIPHTKLGFFAEKLISSAQRVFLLPDGLDLYRQVPTNIDLARFDPTSLTVFVDAHGTTHGRWIDGLATLGSTIRRTNFYREVTAAGPAPYERQAVVVVESPGVERAQIGHLIGQDVLIIEHPSKEKRVFDDSGAFTRLNAAGLGGGLEEWLRELEGREIYIGETFAAILLIGSDFFRKNKVWITVRPEHRENLQPYLAELRAAGAQIL